MGPLTAICMTCGMPYLVAEGPSCGCPRRNAARPVASCSPWPRRRNRLCGVVIVAGTATMIATGPGHRLFTGTADAAGLPAASRFLAAAHWPAAAAAAAAGLLGLAGFLATYRQAFPPAGEKAARGPAARRLLALARWQRRRQARVEQTRQAEWEARALLGVPAGYPEQLTPALRRKHERYLTAVAARLWPHGESDYYDNRDLDEGDP
jgi:hypothetical protein